MADHGYPQLTKAQHHAYAVRALRAQFAAQPPDVQAITRAHVAALLDAETRRGQNQPSWLMQHHQEIYE